MWVDYSLFGHQIVCHHVKGYSAAASRNAGAWCLRVPILQATLRFAAGCTVHCLVGDAKKGF